MTGLKVFTLLLVCTVVASVPLKCKFIKMRHHYICRVNEESAKFDGSRLTIDAIEGKHAEGKSNKDVCSVIYRKIKNLGALPTGLEKFFPHMHDIVAYRSNLKEIVQADFKPFPKLTAIIVPVNQITAIAGDVFKGVPKLRTLSLSRNPITNIDPSAFDGLDQLKRLNLRKLKCKEKLGAAMTKDGVKAIIAKVKKGACKKETFFSVILDMEEEIIGEYNGDDDDEEEEEISQEDDSVEDEWE